MRTIGVGLIGTGYMGKCHALAWTGVHAVFDDTPIVRRVMLCEVEEGLARRRADEFGFEASTDDWRALIADPGVEVVSITTPNALHASMAIAALEAGKHVWCEKPMAPSLEEFRAHGRGSARLGPRRHPRLQLHPEPGHPLHRQADQERRDRPTSPISASKWTRTSWPIPRRRFPGAARRVPATAPWTISASTR